MSLKLVETDYGKSALITVDDSPSTFKHETMDMLAHHGILGMKWGIRRYQPYGHGGYDPENKGKNTGQASKILASMKAAGEKVSESLEKKKKRNADKREKDRAVKEQNRLAEEEWKRQEYLKKQERKREDKADRAEFKAQEKIQKREAEQARREQKKAIELEEKTRNTINKQTDKINEKKQKEFDAKVKKLSEDVLDGKKINTRDLTDDEIRAISARVNSENTLRSYAATAAQNRQKDIEAGKSWIQKSAEQAAVSLGNQAIEAGKKWLINKATDYAAQVSDPKKYALDKELKDIKTKTDELTTRNNLMTQQKNYYSNLAEKRAYDFQRDFETKNMQKENAWYAAQKQYQQNNDALDEWLKKRGLPQKY